jgi:hypothetical protein
VHSALRPSVTAVELDEWCGASLGAGVARVVFESGYSSAVFGADLTDGRRVVVKARPWADRLIGWTEVQRRLFAAGFQCPRPLHGPILIRGLGISFEEFVDGEQVLEGDEAAASLAVVRWPISSIAHPPRMRCHRFRRHTALFSGLTTEVTRFGRERRRSALTSTTVHGRNPGLTIWQDAWRIDWM